jgi:hypothetical protein
MTTPSAYDLQKALLVSEPPRGPRWDVALRLFMTTLGRLLVLVLALAAIYWLWTTFGGPFMTS